MANLRGGTNTGGRSAGQLAEGKTNLDGARKRVGRLENALQQAFLQLGQDAELQQQMGVVMGRGSLELVASTLDGKLPQVAGAEG